MARGHFTDSNPDFEMRSVGRAWTMCSEFHEISAL